MKMNPSSSASFMISAMQVYVHMEPRFITVYVKIILQSGRVHSNFFTAKSLIASLKEITIPRLEFLGNLILGRLMNSVRTAIEKDVKIDNICYQRDSKVCLSWINSEKSFKVFVDSRVKEMKRLSNKPPWYYCEKEKNNTNDLSKKMRFSLSQSKEKKLRWEGPNLSRNTTLNYRVTKTFLLSLKTLISQEHPSYLFKTKGRMTESIKY